ncbi:unnamed protein product [Diabrotica balteata]|uniref:Sof1-like protein domain-containing protein n=1 Tax=Diabrotica balteata TaxID=107213 RepID=A0A9N9SW36_DIABA|nr:unnamed protein product [Diabrotica balteata]
MKVKVISRNPDEYLRETKLEIHKVQRNYDPALHPFEAAREYTRALNAVKLDKMFAKPFLGNLDGHRDGVSSIAKHPAKLSVLISGAFDGEVRLRPREKAALRYSDALKEKFASHPEVKRIARHRQVPKHIYNAQREIHTIKQKQKKREANRRAHSKPGEVPFIPERQKHVLKETQ